MARSAPSHASTATAARLAAFVLERFPFAVAAVQRALDASPRDLRRHVRSLASLVLIAVVLSTVAVAFIAWQVAGLPVAAAVALGAIVAPPDAVAA